MPVPQFRTDNKIVMFEILEFLEFCGDNKISTSLPPDGVSPWGVGGGLVGGGGGSYWAMNLTVMQMRFTVPTTLNCANHALEN